MATTFQEIVGHERQIQTLRRLIEQGRIGGTYLFCGPENVGKESVAIGLAKALLCEDPQRQGCCECKNCRDIETLAHPDVTVIAPSGASQTIGREEIERLWQRSQRTSFYGGWKAGIVRDAHHLHYEAAPRLLKILEEPPEKSVFILITHKEDQLLPTLRSRCKILPFFPLTDIALRSVVEKELLAGEKQGGTGVAADQMNVVERLSGGRPGMAIRITRVGFIPKRDKILKFLETFTAGRVDSLLEVVQGLAECAKTAALNAPDSGVRDEKPEAAESRRREERDVLFCLESLLRDVWVLQKCLSGI